jgi:hypothetical protein
MTSLESAADSMADRRIFWADFDRMLDDMQGWIGRCAAEFGFAAAPARIEEIVAEGVGERCRSGARNQ